MNDILKSSLSKCSRNRELEAPIEAIDRGGHEVMRNTGRYAFERRRRELGELSYRECNALYGKVQQLETRE